MSTTQVHGAAFLDGGGELGALMRAFDWTTTPLGPPDQWPRSLKTAVRIMLTSRQPFWLGWGPELTYLYNDPYKSIIGGKHPWALGRPFAEVWHEIMDIAGPLAESVMKRDEGTYNEKQLLIMERHGYPEEVYYTFSYSPVPDDEGRVAGLICANTEETARVIGERQLALLRELSARTADARTASEACRLAMEALKTNGRDLPFALIFMQEEQGDFQLASASGGDRELQAPSRWPLARSLAEEGLIPVALDADGDYPFGDWPRAPFNAAVMPIIASGSTGRSGALVVGLNPFRRLDDTYRGFLELVSRQVAAAVANAEAYEQEWHRAEALAELDRAKTTFFSNVSHEFRTPLTLMLGPLEDMVAKASAEGALEDRAMLSAVHRNGRRLLKLVNTLLDFARIEAGRAQTTFEATDLAAFTAELAANFRSACERAGLGLKVEVPVVTEPAWIDREMWEKIVLNLLSNAFKFTMQGEIAVVVRERAARFELRVRDTGAGIPSESLPHMFQRFHRVEGTRGRSHEGSGIGLALVQELVRLHGGTIELASETGRGSEFTVSIPKGRAHLPADRVKSTESSAASAVRADAFVQEALSWLPQDDATPAGATQGLARILVADDNADLREYVRRLLATDYHVQAVGNGEEALRAIRQERPDLVVSDVMMPVLDGFALVREIRADSRLRTLPVILLSARAGQEARIEGLASGADDYLVKPFSARELQVRVGALLRSAAVQRHANEEIARNAAQFATLFDAAPLGIYLVDQDFRLAALNPIARPVFGDIPGLIGRDFHEVIHILWPSAYADEIIGHFRHTLETGEPHVVPERIEKRLDIGITEYHEWQVHRIPLPGGRHGVVCYFRDISTVVQAREALRESDRRKDEFIATLSHELRNPLAPIRNALHILALKGEDSPSITRVHEMMERQVNHLVRLVDDLLEISRISRGTMELKREPVELGAVVRHAIETSEPLVQGGGHRLTVSMPGETLWLNADAVRLGQVIGNVLNNAAKYTDRGGLIELDARREADRVVVTIRDNGQGIAPEDRESIFDMFMRGRDQRGQGGLGIGLGLARRLVTMHGGTIEARSEGSGRGSEFVITLPLSLQDDVRESITGRIGLDLSHRNILVVDDNRDAGDSLAMLLRILGADVQVARDGKEALRVLEGFDASIVLLDIGMPDMDGYEVARQIRALKRDTRPAIVALTGWGQEQDRVRARDAGFDHHLTKPAEIAALQSLLSRL